MKITKEWLTNAGIEVHGHMDSHDDTTVFNVTISKRGCTMLLRLNTKNRTVKHNQNADLAKHIEQGRFVFNGDSIRIAEDGLLLDGQNRLITFERVGVSFPHLIITGLDESTRKTMDIGTPRSARDELRIEDYDNPGLLASAMTRVIGLAMANGTSAKTRVSKLDTISLAMIHAPLGLAESVSKFHKGPSAGLGEAVPVALHYVFTKAGMGEQADSALEVWGNGVPAYVDDPIHRVRENFTKLNKVHPDDAVRMFYGAWMARMQNETRKSIKKRDMLVGFWNEEDLLLGEIQ